MKKYILICFVATCLVFGSCSSSRKNSSEYGAKGKRTEELCRQTDSIIMAHQYMFVPKAIYPQTGAKREQLRDPRFMVDVRKEYAQIELPYYRGIGTNFRKVMINEVASDIKDYKAIQSDDGKEWRISFKTRLNSSDEYTFSFLVKTCTGVTELEILATKSRPVTYEGYLRKIP